MPNGHKNKRRDFRKLDNGFEHDDRMGQSGGILRRVKFKNSNSYNRQKGWDNKVKAAFMDEDIDMNGAHHGHHPHHGDKKHGKHNGMRARAKYINDHRRLMESATYWYKVHIKYGHKYDKEYLLKVIQNFIKPVPFEPFAYTVNTEESTFIVGEYKTAEAILQANLKITLSNAWKLNIRVRPITPMVKVDDIMTAAIKEALAGRYDSYNKTLNLSSFHRDAAFIKRALFCPLNRPDVMTALINIVGDSAPDLQGLDLSNNKLSFIDHMKVMIEKLPQIKVLHIGKNKLREMKLFNALKGLPLTEIILDENPLCDRYKDRDVYIRAVRDIFPKVIKLDCQDLPPPILFIDEEVSQLPNIQASFMCNATGAPIVKNFLEQYYQLYDTNDRSQIAQAYHENAEFSLSVAPDPNPPSYLSESRNLLRVPQLDRRVRMLKKGRYTIVKFLNSLPSTQHDPSSFAVDLVVFSPQVIQISVMGVFKDKDGKKNPIRSFSRTFIIVPLGSGFCITNEMLVISPATDDQIRKAFKQVDVLPDAVSSAMASINIAPAELDVATKQQMVANLSMKSGMNYLWSEKCLSETNWNYERAEYAFTELHKAGTIPPEAFAK